jgi:hypothetical protein
VEAERERNKARSGRKPQPLRVKPAKMGDLICEGKPLSLWQLPSGKAPLSQSEILRLPKRMPVPEVANHLVCSICGAKNSDTYHPIWARPDARVPGVTGQYPDFNKR